MPVPNIEYATEGTRVIPEIGYDLSEYLIYRDSKEALYELLRTVLLSGSNVSQIDTAANSTITIESTGGSGGGNFDLWGGVTTSSVPADADRFVIGDASAPGEPNRYVTGSSLRTYAAMTPAELFAVIDDFFVAGDDVALTVSTMNNTITINAENIPDPFSIRVDVGTELSAALADDDRFVVSDTSTADQPNRYLQASTLRDWIASRANIYNQVRRIISAGANIVATPTTANSTVTIESVGGGGGTGLTAVSSDSTLTGAGTTTSPLAVAAPFDEDDYNVDVMTFYVVTTASLVHFDDLTHGETVTIHQTGATDPTISATVAYAYREGNVATLGFRAGSGFEANIGDSTSEIQNRFNQRIAVLTTVVTNESDVDTAGEVWTEIDRPAAGIEAFREIDRRINEDLDPFDVDVLDFVLTNAAAIPHFDTLLVGGDLTVNASGDTPAAQDFVVLHSERASRVVTVVVEADQGLETKLAGSGTISIRHGANVLATVTGSRSGRPSDSDVGEYHLREKVPAAGAETYLNLALTIPEQHIIAETPPAWIVGIHATGNQVAFNRRIYECISPRTAANTDNPATDSTGWRPLSGGTGTGGGISNLNVRLWVTGEAWNAGELARTARGSLYTAAAAIGASSANSQIDPDDATSSLWRPVQGYAGTWTSGSNYRAGNIVDHSGVWYLVIQKVTNSTTAPASDTTNFQTIGNQNLTDAQIGMRAFQNPPSTLDTTQQAAVRTAIGAGVGTTLDDLPIPEWVAMGGYVAGELVRDTHDRVFMCITDIVQSNNAPATDALNFAPVTNYAGDYADSTAYPRGELVSHSGEFYIVSTAVAATNTDDPTGNDSFVRISGGGGSSDSGGGGPFAEEIGRGNISITTGPTGPSRAIDTGIDIPDSVADDEWWAVQIVGVNSQEQALKIFEASRVTGATNVSVGDSANPNSNFGGFAFQTAEVGADNTSGLTRTSSGDIIFTTVQSSWSITLILWRINTAGGSGGTSVEANPSGAATDTLVTLDVDGTIYSASGRDRYRGAWAENAAYEIGDYVSHTGFWYVVTTQITDSGSDGPDTQPTLYRLLTDYAENWSARYYHEGSVVTNSGEVWLATDDVANTDPTPVADSNTKWRLLTGSDGLAADVIVYWVPSSQHAVFDAVSYGDTIDLNYGTGNADTAPATVRSISRELNVATVIIDPLNVWADIVSGSTVIIEDSSNNTIGSFNVASLQTARAGVTAANEWWRDERVATAGLDVWSELDRIDSLDDTHLTLGTRTATSLNINSSTGDPVTVPSASTTQAGLESAADRVQLSASPPIWASATIYDAGDQRVWQGIIYECIVARTIADTDDPATDMTGWAPLTALGETNLSIGTRTGTTMVLASSSGSDATLPVATTSDAGLQSAVDRDQAGALPPHWSAGVWTVGQQCTQTGRIYECIATRAASDATGPSGDTTGWAPVTGDQDLSGYVLASTLTNLYSNTAMTDTAISDALVDLDAVTDQGEWALADTYAQHDWVRHDGASYIALAAVSAGVEPGVTTGWETSWYRWAYSAGPPRALTTPSRTGQVLSFPDIGGQTTAITLPAGENPAPTLAERITFQAIAQGGASTDVEAVPITTNPISVDFPVGGDRTLITSLSGNDFTLKRGVYMVDIEADFSTGNNNTALVFIFRDASDDSEVGRSTIVRLFSGSGHGSAYCQLILNEDTTLNLFMDRLNQQSTVTSEWFARFARWGGSNSFDPATLGVDTFDLTSSAQTIVLTDDTSGNAIVCPETGFLLIKSNIPALGLGNSIDWYHAPDLRADKAAAPGIYTNADNEIVYQVAAHAGGATSNNNITIYYTGATVVGTVTPPPPVSPHIRTWRVTGDATVPAGSIQNRTYDFESQISQSSHVGSARIVGFVGTEQDPTTVTQLHVITNFADETGTLTLPAVTLTANQIYTLRLEVYGTGGTFADTPTLYADYRITAVAVTLNTRFGYIGASEDETDIDFTNVISQSATAAGNWTVQLPDAMDYRMYWAVPTANEQPTAWTTGGFTFTSTIESVDNVTISGASYSIYMTEADSPFDNTSNGTVLVVT